MLLLVFSGLVIPLIILFIIKCIPSAAIKNYDFNYTILTNNVHPSLIHYLTTDISEAPQDLLSELYINVPGYVELANTQKKKELLYWRRLESVVEVSGFQTFDILKIIADKNKDKDNLEINKYVKEGSHVCSGGSMFLKVGPEETYEIIWTPYSINNNCQQLDYDELIEEIAYIGWEKALSIIEKTDRSLPPTMVFQAVENCMDSREINWPSDDWYADIRIRAWQSFGWVENFLPKRHTWRYLRCGSYLIDENDFAYEFEDEINVNLNMIDA